MKNCFSLSVSLKKGYQKDIFKKENKMKKIVIIAGVVIIFLLAAPYLYKVLLYGAGWVIWGFMAYFVGGVPLSDILSWWHIFLE